MEKNKAYYSALSIHCQWEKDTEECLTYKQLFHYKTLHRADWFNSQYENTNQLITIWQEVQQCLQHLITWISWLCRYISDSWEAVSFWEEFSWSYHWFRTESAAFIWEAVLNILSWAQCTKDISRQCYKGEHYTQVNIICSFTHYVCVKVKQ